MRNKILLMFTIFIALTFFYRIGYSQDKGSFIILSDRVGESISIGERNYFGIFPEVKHFQNALFLEDGDKYFCKLSFYRNGNVVDSLFEVDFNQLVNWAFKINYYEKLINNRENLSANSFRFQLVKLKPGLLKMEITDNFGQVVEAKKNKSFELKSFLPLASCNWDAGSYLNGNWAYGITGFIGIRRINYGGLNEIFRALENQFYNGYASFDDRKISVSSQVTFGGALFVIYKGFLKLDFQYYYSGKDNNDTSLKLKSASLLVSYIWKISDIFSPYLTLGFNSTSFTAKSSYDYSLGNGDILKDITIEGNTRGLVVGGGVNFKVVEDLSLNLFVNYFLLPEIKKVNSTYLTIPSLKKPTVDVSGLSVGIAFLIK